MLKLSGSAVAEKLTQQVKQKMTELNVSLKLAVVRVGNNAADLAYQKGIIKRFASVGAQVEVCELQETVSTDELTHTINNLNADASVNGILLFRPLPANCNLSTIKSVIDVNKDVDGMGYLSQAMLYEGKECNVPCTARAVMEVLDYYGIELAGKNVVVVGRSTVIGRPVALLLLSRHATVTICHTRTVNLPQVCAAADILIACAGSTNMIKAEHTHPQQIIIDVGINSVNGKICGDVDYYALEDKVAALTPVPGGVGSVTTAVLLRQTLDSALKARQE